MAEGNEREWFLIVGLGNPGREYAGNRHNVGFHCLDRLAKAHHFTFQKWRSNSELSTGQIAGRRAILLKPQTFVNASGEAVGPVSAFFKVAVDRVLAIYDDLDLPQGTIRLRPGGGSGGHKGIRSIAEHLGTRDFPRLRVGIGRPPGRMEPRAYVLQDWSDAQREEMEEVYDRVAAAVATFLKSGIAEAMNCFNARPRDDEDAKGGGGS